MTPEDNQSRRFRQPLLQGVLPINSAQVPAEIIAGITLAALAIPEVMGYTKIAGTPVITGLYTMLIPMALFAIFGSSRHLVVGADSATAAILGAGLSGTFVVNGSPTKTQMVDSAGGRTQLSLIVTAVIVLLVLLFLTAPLAYMPEAVLSAVVFLVGIDLIDLKGMHSIRTRRPSEFWIALITALAVVLVGVEPGSYSPSCCR